MIEVATAGPHKGIRMKSPKELAPYINILYQVGTNHLATWTEVNYKQTQILHEDFVIQANCDLNPNMHHLTENS